MGNAKVHVLLSTYDSRGGVEPLAALATALRAHGAAHDVQVPTAESLSAALRTALAPQTRARARAVAATIRTDGATVAAKLLVDAVSGDRPPALGGAVGSRPISARTPHAMTASHPGNRS